MDLGRAVDLERGQRVRLPGEADFVLVDSAPVVANGSWRCYVTADESGAGLRAVELTEQQAAQVEVLAEDGGADPAEVLAGLWTAWMRQAAASSKATAMASVPLMPYPHQNQAVYGAMLPQPMLRFLLADEPGTGKTIMGGLWLREAQRLGLAKRALIVAPAHLVTKWQADYQRFLGGELRRVTSQTAETDSEGVSALSVFLKGGHDNWIVSLELAAQNPAVSEAIHPDRAGWDAVIFDEAHRMTPTAATLHSVGRMLSENTPRAVLMTATPHRGDEWLFRSLMHLVDPKVFPAVDKSTRPQPSTRLQPGSLHFLRRMKEELVDYDGATKLFGDREAVNIKVPLNTAERAYYNEALEMVEQFFAADARELAKMVYGKRAASSLHALAQTLRRRLDQMGSASPSEAARAADPDDDDEASADEARVVVEGSQASREERKAVKEMLRRLDRDAADPALAVSKWPRLLDDCLTPNDIAPGGGRQLVVFTEFADTADWLVRRFEAAGFTARRYWGRDSHTVRDEIRAGFAAGHFQVLVSTDAGNEGIDLQTAQVLVNWDIPWSLVRLEQRMGRIHRVGQTGKVWLYNLVATDTREGDALSKLLDRLVEAANELGGKMFDSLSLVGGEVTEALARCGVAAAGGGRRTDGLARLLRQTYEPGGDRRAIATDYLAWERVSSLDAVKGDADLAPQARVQLNESKKRLHRAVKDSYQHVFFLSEDSTAGQAARDIRFQRDNQSALDGSVVWAALVEEAKAFGSGQLTAGALVFNLSDGHMGRPLSEIRDSFWNTPRLPLLPGGESELRRAVGAAVADGNLELADEGGKVVRAEREADINLANTGIRVREPGAAESVGQAGTVTVPDLTGKPLAAAGLVLGTAGLKLESPGAAEGSIVAQHPRPGEQVPAGTSVTVEVAESQSSGEQQVTVTTFTSLRDDEGKREDIAALLRTITNTIDSGKATYVNLQMQIAADPESAAKIAQAAEEAEVQSNLN